MNRFPDDRRALSMFMAQDAEFLAMCDDYDACVNALGYWTRSSLPEAQKRVDEYHGLISALEKEIAQVLLL